MSASTQPRVLSLIGYLIVATAIVGYFVGIQSPMNPLERLERSPADLRVAPEGGLHAKSPLPSKATASTVETADSWVVEAASYSEMAAIMARRRQPSSISSIATSTTPLEAFAVDPLVVQQASMAASAEATISLEEKRTALAQRQTNRAYNGAPPTVTHPIDQMTTEACVACHTQGAKLENFRIPKMSHPSMVNCTQCHVGDGIPASPSELFRESRFVGLAAPESGPRAYPGAPPQIPHSTWMRNDCASCHGPTSLRGIQTTHPWRQNCQQCHAPSSMLDQILLDERPQFVTAPVVVRE